MRWLGGLGAAMALCAIAATPASGASTRAEYIAQADPICAEWVKVGNEQLKGFGKDVVTERWKSASRRFRVSLAAYQSMLTSLSAIQAPPTDATVVAQWLDGLRAEIPLVRSVMAALKRHSIKKVDARTKRLAAAANEAQAIVAGFGFQTCNEA